MLVTKKKTNSIKAVKLTTGEEFIALCEGVEAHGYRFKRPLVMVMTENQSGGTAHVVFAPWMIGVEPTETITISETHIICMVDAAANAAREYEQATGLSADK